MKKLGITVAVLACVASMVSAETVTSANVVGYNKVDRVNGLQVVGSSWNAGAIGEVLGYDFAGDTRASRATKLYSFDGAVYTGFYLYDDGSIVEWRFMGDDTSAESVVLSNSVSLFISDREVLADDAIVMSGEVNSSEYATNSVLIGLSLITYPYSVDVDSIDDLELTAIGDADSRSSRADKIIIFDSGSSTYVSYYLHEDLGNFEPRAWVPVDGSYGDAVPGIPNGSGFFYSSRGNLDWVELNPYFNNL